jgi:hypothetical protein
MPFSHSLLGAVVLSIVVFLLTRKVGFALATLSHFFGDLPFHVPDLTIAGGVVKYGFGLWNQKWVRDFSVFFVVKFLQGCSGVRDCLFPPLRHCALIQSSHGKPGQRAKGCPAHNVDLHHFAICQFRPDCSGSFCQRTFCQRTIVVFCRASDRLLLDEQVVKQKAVKMCNINYSLLLRCVVYARE